MVKDMCERNLTATVDMNDMAMGGKPESLTNYVDTIQANWSRATPEVIHDSSDQKYRGLA